MPQRGEDTAPTNGGQFRGSRREVSEAHATVFIAPQIGPQLPSLYVKSRLFALTLVLLMELGSSAAQSPVIHRAIPLAIQPGQPTPIRFVGENLSGATELWTSFPAKPTRILSSDPSAG